MDKLNNEFFFSTLSHLNVEENGRAEYKVTPEFGDGKIVLYRVLNGLYVISSDSTIRNNMEQSQAFYKRGGLFYKLIEGKFYVNINNEKAVVVNKGDIVNFSGDAQDKVIEGKHFGERILTIGLYFYYDELAQSLSENHFDSSAFKEYIDDERIRQILVYRGDSQIEKVISELWHVVQEDNRFLIRTKALELLHYVTNNYKKHLSDSKKKYDERIISQVIEMKHFLDMNLDRYFTIPELAKRFGLSQTYTKEIFKELYGNTIYQYHLSMRLEAANVMVTQEVETKISEIALKTGFSSSSKFTQAYKKKYGISPSCLRSQKNNIV